MLNVRRYLPKNNFFFKSIALIWFGAGVFVFSIYPCRAQMFGNEADVEQESPAIAVSPQQPRYNTQQVAHPGSNRASPRTTVATPSQSATASPRSVQQSSNVPAQNVSAQQMDTQTQEPQPEPQAAYQFRFVGDEVIVDTKPKIFLYSRDFKISRNMNGSINCTMRFFVLSTMKEKITNISYRLKWPEMETALSFDDVEPNIANYFDYSLLGNGCYSMDKVPNIIVNRCRVKGMSQKQCADTIQWLN